MDCDALAVHAAVTSACGAQRCCVRAVTVHGHSVRGHLQPGACFSCMIWLSVRASTASACAAWRNCGWAPPGQSRSMM